MDGAVCPPCENLRDPLLDNCDNTVCPPKAQGLALERVHSNGSCALFHPGQDQFEQNMFLYAGPEGSKEQRDQMLQLGCTSNVLFLARASELATMSWVNMMLCIASVMYVGVNAVCVVLNYYIDKCKHHQCTPPATDKTFHNMEFIATFLFNVADLLALSYSPKKLSNAYSNPLVLKMIVYINVLCSFTSALLVYVSLEKFETVSHELEYGNELTLAVFDLLILWTLLRGMSGRLRDCATQCNTIFCIMLAVIIAVIQLGLYNFMGWTADGDSKGETTAHYFEFMFEILSASITFWFTLDNKFMADSALSELMRATHVPHQV